ncbi:mannosyltransferase family protein [Corynebacterium lizhenjunii]|nr:mannosyltransferase family protein [Corynebacterium lizhenjunii]
MSVPRLEVPKALGQRLGPSLPMSPAPHPAMSAGTAAGIAAAIALGGTAVRIGMLAWLAAAQDSTGAAAHAGTGVAGDTAAGPAAQPGVGQLLDSWDAQHYLGIAKHGYATEESFAFFPAYPALLRLVGGTVAAGCVLSVVCTAVMAAGVMALARRMGAGLWGQVAAAIVVTSAPMSIVFAMPYTEALFGALAVWALVLLVDRKWIAAGVVVCALGGVRLTAVCMIAAFAALVLLRGRGQPRAWVGLALTPWVLVGYLAWASAHLEHGYFGLQREHWNSAFDFGAATWHWLATTLTTGTNVGYLLSTAAMVAVPLALVLAWRRVDLGVWLFSAALAANVLLSDGLMHSRPRLLLPAALLGIPWALRAAARPVPGAVLVGAWVLFGAWFSAYMLVVFEWAI